MSRNKYKIVDDFQAGSTDVRVLVLDRDYDFRPYNDRGVVIIEGKEYAFSLNSMPSWVLIKSHDSFTGKQVEFA